MLKIVGVHLVANKDVQMFIIDEQLKFHLHINHVVASAFTRANLILKCFTSRHVQACLLHAFKTYVLPVIEYASMSGLRIMQLTSAK